MLLADYESYIKCQDRVSETYAVSWVLYSTSVFINLYIKNSRVVIFSDGIIHSDPIESMPEYKPM